MKAVITIVAAAAAAFVSLAAQAQSTTQPLTRAQVQAELSRARAAGEMDFAAQELNGASATVKRAAPTTAQSPAPSPAVEAPKAAEKTSGLTRAQVQAELARARKSGELEASTLAGYGLPAAAKDQASAYASR